MKVARTAIATALITLAATAHAAPLSFTQLWTYDHALTGVAGQKSEIVSFDALTNSLWVAGVVGIDVLNASNGTLVQHLSTAAFGEVNSVAIYNGLAAVAIAAPLKTNPGSIRFYDTATRTFSGSVGVGALPDMVTFTPNGSRLLVANEGEPSTLVDPRGSVSIVDVASRTVTATAGFGGNITFNGSHIRTFNGIKGGTTMDFEPEYIAVSSNGSKAFIGLQEANAIATLDLITNRITTVTGLGVKDFSAPGNEIDPTDRDYLSGNRGPTRTILRSVNARGFYQPDGIVTFASGGKDYLVMANEGDSRADEQDEARGNAFGGSGDLARLTVSTADSSTGDLYAFGARSFSIRDTAGNLVFDSGSELDRKAIELGIYDDGRSDNKGVEPEGVTLGVIGGRTLAFIGLERTTKMAVAVYDITDPANASFVDIIVSNVDRSPEGLTTFVNGGVLYLAVSSEVSDTTSVFSISAVPEPSTWAMLAGGLALIGWRSRRRQA